MRLAYILIKYEGLRRGEVVNIDKSDINLEQNIITLRKTKGGNTNVKIPIHPKLARALRWIAFNNWPEGRIVPYHPASITKAFTQAMLKAGCRKASPVHILRHTFVTRILQESKNIFLMQKLARHADISTIKIYEHLTANDLQEEFAKIKL